jgi:hypothetical protein
MSHALIQRKSISLFHPFLITLEFSCWSYPQCISESHEVVVLLCTPDLVSLWVGSLETSRWHSLIGR